MKYSAFKLILICAILICANKNATGQTLYGLKKSINGSPTIPFDVVSVDPNTGSTTVEVSTNSLIGVAAGATAYDQQNSRYICWGIDTTNNQQLYVVNIDSSTSASVPFASVQAIEMEYDLQTQKAYGLWWDGSAEHFGEINLTTGIVTSIATLPGVDGVAIGNSTFDSNTGTYIFIGVDGNDTKLYSIQASNGAILSSPTIMQNGDRYFALEFNNNDNKLYGLYEDIDSNNYNMILQTYYKDLRFAEINLTTGASTVLNAQNSIIDGYMAGYAIGGLCFDQQTETYIVYVQNENSAYLKLIDATTANVVTSTALTNNDYFYELQVDNYPFAVSFYQLPLSIEIEKNSLSVLELDLYPNPTTDYLIIETKEELESILIYNSNGQIAKRIEEFNGNQISVSDLPNGNYFMVAKAENKQVQGRFSIR